MKLILADLLQNIMGVSHSNRQDRSCPPDGEGKIIYTLI